METFKVFTIEPKGFCSNGVTIAAAESVQQAHKLLIDTYGKDYVNRNYNKNDWTQSKELFTTLTEPKIIFDAQP